MSATCGHPPPDVLGMFWARRAAGLVRKVLGLLSSPSTPEWRWRGGRGRRRNPNDQNSWAEVAGIAAVVLVIATVIARGGLL
jgi:hypothetical protein